MQVAVVTGASSGVGRAIVRALAKRGARIGLIARGLDALGSTAEEVEALGGEPLVLPVDVSDASAVDRGAHGKFDVVSRDRSVELWLRLHRGTLLAALLLAALLLRRA